MYKSQLVICGLVAFLAFGCSGRKVDMDEDSAEQDNKTAEEQAKDAKDARIESLTTSLSRAQSRIEELDAKLSALTDKVDATRLAVDNVTGTAKPLKTEAVGAAAHETAPLKAEPAPTTEAKTFSKLDGATGDFNRAMTLFRAGKFSDAELSFNHFTERFPEHVLAGSAQFYAGESYFLMHEYKLALNEYNKVVSSFATSPRVPSAMVRMAHCYEALGNNTEATRTIALVRDLYEGNPSLDWPGPGKKHAASAPAQPSQQGGLKAGPMEPAGHDEGAKHAKQDEEEEHEE